MGTAFHPPAAGTLLVALAALVPSPATSQTLLDPTGSPPAVIKVYQAWPRPGHEGLAMKAGAGFGAVMDRFRTADWWIGGTSMSGRGELAWLEGFPTHAAIGQQLGNALANPAQMAAGDSVWQDVGSHLEGAVVLWAFHRPDLGYRPTWFVPSTRAFQVITFRIKAGMEADGEAVFKTFAQAYADAGVEVPWMTYQVSNGMAGPAYLMIVPMASLEAIDRDLAGMGTVVSKVPDMGALMAQWARSGSSVAANVYAVVPSLSRVPSEFARAGGGWWGR
jgi:hypothetical protein